MVATWQNRIIRRADVDPAQLLANPKNFRRHTKAQKDAFRGIVAQVGYVDPVLAQDGTGIIIDGHLRVDVALEDGVPTIPVDYTDSTDEEADLILATKDPLAAMAYHDAEALSALLASVQADDPAVQAMLDDLRSEPVFPVEAPEAFPAYDEDIATEHRCPSCGYEWSGKPA